MIIDEIIMNFRFLRLPKFIGNWIRFGISENGFKRIFIDPDALHF